MLAASSLNAHQRKSRKEQLWGKLDSLDVPGALSLLFWQLTDPAEGQRDPLSQLDIRIHQKPSE